MSKKFVAEQFTPTKWDSAEQKAKFANQFVRFVEGGFKEAQFPKWFYTRLSMTFGHIAHYDQGGFYGHFFSDLAGMIEFVKMTERGGQYGEYGDVERGLAAWIVEAKWLEKLEATAVSANELIERALLAKLKAKYEGEGNAQNS